MAAVDYWDGERRGWGAVGRSRAKHWWFACILAAVVVGCADRGSEDGEDSAAAGPDDQAGELVEPFTEDRELRATRTVAYDTAWSFGGPDDTLLASPHKLDVASDGGLYVLDVRAMKVLRIDGGRLAWAWGSSGQGPGEIGNVRAMTVDPRTDAPFLVDSGNRRLVWLSSDGTLSREQPFAGQALMTEDVVALADGSGYVASFFGMTETRGVLGIDLMRIPSDGESPAVVTPSWPGFRDLETIQLDMLVFAASGASWGLAFKTGPGFFLVADDATRAHSFVERMDFPEVTAGEQTEEATETRSVWFAERPTESASDVDTAGDTLFVLAGDSDGRGVLDLYSMATGRYLESRLLPGRFRSFALAGDTTYVVDQSGVVPRILALVAREGQP